MPVTFTVNATSGPADTTAPEVAVTSPATGSSVTTPTPTIQGTAGTASGDDASVSVRLYSGSTAGGTPAQTVPATVGTDGSWSVDASAMADGTWTVQASQGDDAGNVGTSDPVTFTVDTTPADISAPEVAVTAPAADATVDDATPTIAGTGGTATGDDDQVSVAFYPSSEVQGDAGQTIQATVGSDGSWSGTPTALDDGTWTVQATQTDAAGNVGTSTPVTFTVSTTPADTTAPTVSITTPVTGATVVSTSLSAGGAASTDPGDEATVTLDMYAGTTATGTPTGTATAAVAAGSWSATLTGVAAGTYTLVAEQADAAGNTGSSAPVTVTMVAPPTVTSTTPATLGQGASAVTVRSERQRLQLWDDGVLLRDRHHLDHHRADRHRVDTGGLRRRGRGDRCPQRECDEHQRRVGHVHGLLHGRGRPQDQCRRTECGRGRREHDRHDHRDRVQQPDRCLGLGHRHHCRHHEAEPDQHDRGAQGHCHGSEDGALADREKPSERGASTLANAVTVL